MIRYSVSSELKQLIISELTHWQNENKISRLLAGDSTLWTSEDEGQWIGWLNLPMEKEEIPVITQLAKELSERNITDVVVLGMGGSSLCPAMFAEIFGKIKGCPRLHVLDSTDPLQIHALEKAIDLKNSFFIVSSKSGTTLEPNIFLEYFYHQLQVALNKKAVGDQFIAITDPGTPLVKHANSEYFKSIFYGVPSVGGRYSALSNFGMVPLGLMGGDVANFLQHAEIMRTTCLSKIAIDNPAMELGVVLGTCAVQGKDKVTFIMSPAINSFGAWLEQLLAESTGKEGKGLIPVDEEPLGPPAVYDNDRVFVYIRLTTAADPIQDKAVTALEQAGFAVIRLEVTDTMHLGAEIFLWEMATAVAGSVIGINPFNQPDVEASKKLALKITSDYEKTGQFQQPQPFFSAEGLQLFSSQPLASATTLSDYLHKFLQLAQLHDYVDFSAFITMSKENLTLLQKSRVRIRDQMRLATCLGFGPRFLHSTGQAYKGGPNTGLFLQITADHPQDIPVPGHQYTFGFVINAQAHADFTVLAERGRRVLRIHLGTDVEKGLQALYKSL